MQTESLQMMIPGKQKLYDWVGQFLNYFCQECTTEELIDFQTLLHASVIP